MNPSKLTVSTKTFLKTTLSVLLFTACVNPSTDIDENIKPNLEKIPISLSSRILQVQNLTRMNETSFEENDSIGLFVLNQNETLNGERHIDNAPFVFNGLSFVSEEQYFYPDVQLPSRFISYYPYKETGIEAENSLISIQVKADQSIALNYSLSDFLTAKTESVTPTSNAVLLNFMHRFSKVNFFIQPTLEDDLDDLAINASLSIRNLFCEADYDLESDIISNLTATKRITANGSWNVDSNNMRLTGKKVIIIPQNSTNGQIVLQVKDRTFVSEFPDLNFQGGVCYNVILKYDSKIGISSITHQITDWEMDETEYESDLNEDLSKNRIAVNKLNFDISSVYNICDDDGVILGKICKEYLSNELIDAAALVYYSEQSPLNGLVLNVLDETNFIHGGTLQWSNTENTFEYTIGKKATIDILYLDELGNYIEEPLDNSSALIAKPYYLIDNRVTESISYPTVKIGKQIWTRENLRTTFYTDGLQIADNTSDLSRTTEGYFKQDNEFYYNLNAVSTGQLAPNGWSIPTEDSWRVLINYVGNESSKLKAGDNWRVVANVDAPNNVTGFTGLPLGGFYSVGTPTSFVTTNYFGIYWRMNNNGIDVHGSAFVLNAGMNEIRNMNCYESCAYSIRLVKN